MLYPYTRTAAPRPASGIDAWTGPGWRLVERHELQVEAPPEAALQALASTPLRELPAVTALFALRGLRFDREATLREFFSTRPFMLLAEEPGRELVFGVLSPAAEPDGSRRWPATPAEFVHAAVRAPLGAVVNFRAEPAAGGTRLWTETSVRTSGTAAGLRFAAYWLAIGPWSAWMRRLFLRVARARAERR